MARYNCSSSWAFQRTSFITSIDFMSGSPELRITGLTADGERVPVLVGGSW